MIRKSDDLNIIALNNKNNTLFFKIKNLLKFNHYIHLLTHASPNVLKNFLNFFLSFHFRRRRVRSTRRTVRSAGLNSCPGWTTTVKRWSAGRKIQTWPDSISRRPGESTSCVSNFAFSSSPRLPRPLFTFSHLFLNFPPPSPHFFFTTRPNELFDPIGWLHKKGLVKKGSMGVRKISLFWSLL